MINPHSRRRFLQYGTLGLGNLGLAMMLHGADNPSGEIPNPLAPKQPHFAPKAKRLIHIFLNGGMSHVDTFDPKPALNRYAGKALPVHLRTERKTGAAFPSPFSFRKFGQSGLEISEIFPQIGDCADDICVIRSMYTDIPNHEPSFLMMNCGATQQVRPSMGSWLTYGLGSENQNLPGFIVLCPNGLPTRGAVNWRSAFLPGTYQGSHIDTSRTRVDELVENISNASLTREDQRAELDALRTLNRAHAAAREDDSNLQARLQSFELAFRMQMEAQDAFDISKEPESVRSMYGDTLHGRQMLIARRLSERGVRVVQVWHGAGQPWDSHSDIKGNHGRLAHECDQPVAALLKDLKQRGLLNETLILFSPEFGRTPVVELADFGSNLNGAAGRDHNSYGFSAWLAGAGVKTGQAYGATDEFGFRAVEDRVHVHDLHATMLQLFGFNHERLTYRYAGRDFRLTDVSGQVIKGVLA